ncbi:hypothetical protein CEXT_655171 [Caerostris extrusa]|uniref:Uncharacterized protein n=1 Tax=Caerostris extrusa TaxID=172846 RepID=A0AAV4QZ97_CAEEX|nr:hypothetical protein CEXT_655171 [Caerostris extrusa]
MFSKPSLLFNDGELHFVYFRLGLILMSPNIPIQLLFACTIHFVCVASVLWSAGTVPVALNKLKEVFNERAHSRLLSAPTPDEIQMILVKKELIDKTNFALSGWDIVVYKKKKFYSRFCWNFAYLLIADNR